jgi:Tfp pilus assembly protein PilX
MSTVFAIVCLVQLALSIAWLGLRPGRGSYLIIVLQLALVLAFSALVVYSNSQLRQARRDRRVQAMDVGTDGGR